MSNILAEYAQTEQTLKMLQGKLDKLSEDPRLLAELEFKNKLEALMREYDKSAANVIALLDPRQVEATQEKPVARRKRKLKIYKNPTTEEVIETRGGNHKLLKEWKDEHGADTVESWLVRVEE